MQDAYLPVCIFIRYMIDILVYLYHVCMLISVSISASTHNVSSIAPGRRGETSLPISHYVVAVLKPTLRMLFFNQDGKKTPWRNADDLSNDS